MKFNRNIFIFFTAIFIATGFLIYSAYQNKRGADASRNLVIHAHDVIEKSDLLRSSIISVESDIRGYVITSNPVFLKDYEKQDDKILLELSELEALTQGNKGHQNSTGVLKQLVNHKLEFQNRILSNYRSSPQQALKLIESLEGRNTFSSINSILNNIQNIEKTSLIALVNTNKGISDNQFIKLIIVGTLALLLTLFTFAKMHNENILRSSAEKKALFNEAKYKGLIENSSFVIFTTDVTGIFNYVSERCYQLTEFRPQQLIGQHYSVLIKEDKKEEVNSFYKDQFLNNITETTLIFPIETASKKIKWVEQHTVLLRDQEKAIGFQSIDKDITKARINEEQLKEAEEKLRLEQQRYAYQLQAILNHMPMIVYLKNLERQFIMVNSNFKMVTGLTEKQIIGKTTNEIYPNIDQIYLQTDEHVLEAKQSIEFESVFLTKEGERTMLITKFPLFDNNNQLFAICGVDKDITDIAEQRQQLVDAKVKAEKAEKLQEEFLANMSHEIRTPMNGIMGMSNLLAETQLTNTQREYLEVIKMSADSLFFLINDILDLSKIKAGRMEVEEIDFDLKDVLERVLSPYLVKSEKEVTFSYSIKENESLYLHGDFYKLLQILNNIISNAAKFTSKGHVAIEVKVTESENKRALLQFQVSDTGIGIADEHLNSIFDSFSQVNSSSTTNKLGGTGLGLAITKRLVELQGGRIEVDSKLGVGTTFTFYLPYQKATQATFINNDQKLPVLKQNLSIEGKKILIVEDNAVNQKVITSILAKDKAVCTVANNGSEAVRLLEEGDVFDVIIMDLQMPVMNGFQATAYIREKLKNATPIIAMTASALRNEKIECFEVGMDEYLTKPFAPDTLVYHISRFVNSPVQVQQHVISEIKEKESLYNLEYLSGLDNDEYVIEILELILNTAPLLVADIHKSVLEEDWENVYQKSHELKSCVGPLQINNMLEIAGQLEVQAHENESRINPAELSLQLVEEFNFIKPMLEMEISKLLTL